MTASMPLVHSQSGIHETPFSTRTQTAPQVPPAPCLFRHDSAYQCERTAILIRMLRGSSAPLVPPRLIVWGSEDEQISLELWAHPKQERPASGDGVTRETERTHNRHVAPRAPKTDHTRGPYKIGSSSCRVEFRSITIAPFGDAYEKIGTIQRRLAWPLHKDDTLFQSGRPTGLNIYLFYFSIVEEDQELCLPSLSVFFCMQDLDTVM